jgi:cell division protein FtsL
MESEVIVMNKTKVKFTRFEKIVIFTMLGLAASFIAAFFVLRYIVLNVSFAP